MGNIVKLIPLWSQSDPINGELKPHVYGKRQTANGRFKLRISQNMNRTLADRNSSKQLLWIKNCVILLIKV